MKKKLYSVLIASIILSCNLYGQTIQQPFNWDEFNKKATYLSDLQFSPDGNHILYSTRNSDFDSNKWVIEHHLMNISSKEDSILQFDQKDVREIKWSPSGKYLSFLATDEDNSQIYVQEIFNRRR